MCHKMETIKLLFYLHIFQDSWVQLVFILTVKRMYISEIEVGKKTQKTALSIETEDHLLKGVSI